MPSAGGFTQVTSDLSCDWEKYTGINEMLVRINKEYKDAVKGTFKKGEEYSICSLNVEDVLSLNDIEGLIHDPVQNIPEIIGIPNNRAHCLLMCDLENKSPKAEKEKLAVKARYKIAQISKLVYFDELKWIELIKKNQN